MEYAKAVLESPDAFDINSHKIQAHKSRKPLHPSNRGEMPIPMFQPIRTGTEPLYSLEIGPKIISLPLSLQN